MGGGGGEGLHFRWMARQRISQTNACFLVGVQQMPPNCPPMAKQHHQIKCSVRGGTV